MWRIVVSRILITCCEIKIRWHGLKNYFTPYKSLKYYIDLEKQLNLMEEIEQMLDVEKKYIISVLENSK